MIYVVHSTRAGNFFQSELPYQPFHLGCRSAVNEELRTTNFPSCVQKNVRTGRQWKAPSRVPLAVDSHSFLPQPSISNSNRTVEPPEGTLNSERVGNVAACHSVCPG